MLLPLALALMASYYGNPPTLDSLPAPGTIVRIVARQYLTGVEAPCSTDTTWIERGTGTGVRTRHRKSRNGELEGFREEGFANGLPFPDLTQRSYKDESYHFTTTMKRIRLESGDLWTSCPERLDKTSNDCSLYLILRDPSGREIERRDYTPAPRVDSSGFYNSLWIKTTRWGQWGAVVESDTDLRVRTSPIGPWDEVLHPERDPSCGDTCIRFIGGTLDSTIWQDGQITAKITYQSSSDASWKPYRSGVYEATWQDGIETTKRHYRLPQAPGDLPNWSQWRIGDSLLVETSWFSDATDTTRIVHEPDGSETLRCSRADNSYSVERHDASGRIVSSIVTAPSGVRYGDSSIWVDGRLAQNVSFFICDSLGTCESNRIDYEYATLDAATGIVRAPAPPRLAVHQNGRTLRWTGTLPDGASVELRSLDGRLLGSTHFQDGTAVIERTPAAGLVLWHVEGGGKRLGDGGFLVR